jgi:hypothetical protein
MKSENPVSEFAFKFNVHRYIVVALSRQQELHLMRPRAVGLCRLESS